MSNIQFRKPEVGEVHRPVQFLLVWGFAVRDDGRAPISRIMFSHLLSLFTLSLQLSLTLSLTHIHSLSHKLTLSFLPVQELVFLRGPLSRSIPARAARAVRNTVSTPADQVGTGRHSNSPKSRRSIVPFSSCAGGSVQ